MAETLKKSFAQRIKRRSAAQDKPLLSSGWAEGPLAHNKYSTSVDKENEYFMQWVHPLKLHRLALRTPLGYRLTYGLGNDIWNNDIGIKIKDQPEFSSEINKKLLAYLKTRTWLRSMRIFTGGWIEQGETALLLYFDEISGDNYAHFETPIDKNEEILKVEAVNYMDYKILTWDDYGYPEMYVVNIHLGFKGAQGVRVHASRMMRFTDYELYEKSTGYAKLAVVYDSIVIHSNIVKASGEAAFRWGTGHPLILTKNILDDTEIAKIKAAIGTPTRRSWHILPSEYIESFEMKGQAGQMLNLKALSDIALENVIIGSKMPRAVMMGEQQVAAGTVEDRNFYGLLDEYHGDLEPFVRRYFERDINIRKLLNGIPEYEIDFGIRPVLNVMDQEELFQRKVSNALAMTTITTINESRRYIGYPPLAGQEGEIILGVDTLLMSTSDESNDLKEKDKSTKQASKTSKDIEKDKTINKNKLRENKKQVKDAISSMRDEYSVDRICELMGIAKTTFYKIENWVKA